MCVACAVGGAPADAAAAAGGVVAEAVLEGVALIGREDELAGSSTVVVVGEAPDELAASVPVAWELAVLESVPVDDAFKVKLAELAVGELLARPISDSAVVTPATCDGPGLDMGWEILVER